MLTYGPGSWSKANEAELRQLLAHSRLVLGPDTVALAPHSELITSYRMLVNEFYLKINSPVHSAKPAK